MAGTSSFNPYRSGEDDRGFTAHGRLSWGAGEETYLLRSTYRSVKPQTNGS